MKMHNRSLFTVHSLLFIAYCLLSTVYCLLSTAFAEDNPCLACHSEFSRPAKFVHAAMKMGCEICHQPAEDMKHPGKKGSMKLVYGIPLLCNNCHESKTTKKNVHKPAARGRCTYCHNVHMSDNTALVTMRTPKYEIKHVNDICVSCHLDLAVGVHLLAGLEGPHPMWKKPDPSRPGREISCVSCHDPHSSDFPMLAPRKNLCVQCHKKFS